MAKAKIKMKKMKKCKNCGCAYGNHRADDFACPTAFDEHGWSHDWLKTTYKSDESYNPYTEKRIKVVDMFQTDLLKGDLEDGEEVIFESMRNGRVLATVEIRDDQYILNYAEGRAQIPFKKEAVK